MGLLSWKTTGTIRVQMWHANQQSPAFTCHQCTKAFRWLDYRVPLTLAAGMLPCARDCGLQLLLAIAVSATYIESCMYPQCFLHWSGEFDMLADSEEV